MLGDGASGQSEHPELDDEARADARDVLTDLLEWQLAAQRWERVEQIVAAIAEALAAGDVDGLREATAELELAGPVRVTRLGATPLLPAPDRVRDVANHLVHSLGSDSPQPSGSSDLTGARRDDDAQTPTG